MAGKQPNRPVTPTVVVTPRTYVAVPGTWGWRDRDTPNAWFQASSPFAQQIAAGGYTPLRPWPFLWTTRINGSDGWRRWLTWVLPRSWETSDHLDWQAGGEALFSYCEAERWPDCVIAHSHGGQVVAYACAQRGLKIPLLITVSTPVRSDLRLEYAKARLNVGRWIHIFDTDADPMAWAGQFGDGSVSFSRLMPEAENYGIKGVGHTGALNDPRVVQRLIGEGWLLG